MTIFLCSMKAVVFISAHYVVQNSNLINGKWDLITYIELEERSNAKLRIFHQKYQKNLSNFWCTGIWVVEYVCVICNVKFFKKQLQVEPDECVDYGVFSGFFRQTGFLNNSFFQDDGVVKISSIISILWLIKWRKKLLK